mmetsp:Transcript_55208/g.131112  ORF Transcript_55208/g.131112 Transcript_55208/m.131112 type:complete len:240 (+) Transcript_55208:675-1394(+)
MVQVGEHDREQPREVVALAGEDLVNGHELDLIILLPVRPLGSHVLAEPELALDRRVALVCLRHVLIHFGEGDVEVEAEGEEHPRYQYRHHRVGGVFEVCELDLHASELDPPPDVGANGRGLPPHRLPVGRLDVLEVVRGRGVRDVDSLRIDDKGVAYEEVCHVLGQLPVDSCGDESGVGSFVDRARDIIVPVGGGSRVAPPLAVADVRRDALVSALGKRPAPSSRHEPHLPLVRRVAHL